MTLSDLTSKTPEELNVMCAELCGWHVKITEHFKILSPPSSEFGLCCGLHLDDEEVWQFGLTGDENGNYKFPNYTGSWDAIMPEVRKLTNRHLWMFNLAEVVGIDVHANGRSSCTTWTIDECDRIQSAAPLQLTQALILTLHP